MKINIYLSENDLEKLEEFRGNEIKKAEKHNNEYIIESFTESSIEKLVGFYLTSQLNNW
ncbi:hypothetical protein ACIQYS_01600 [Psychrobacillus sp. NPDC096426]|uniref:hypothetical protein n=1 Tax=Psychrobacillus sp. NPDC096426 TaxID=3364491 RepID=UPI0038195389